MLIGQDKIKNMLASATLDAWPCSSILLAEFGAGKHLVVDLLSKQLNLTIYDLTRKLTQETIESIYEKPEPAIYLIDSNNINVKQQNVILKFLEEPLRGSFIILLCENKSKLLSTIVNRCQVITFETYTKEELQTFLTTGSNVEFILDIATTPGQVQLLQQYNLSEMIVLAEKMIDKMSTANFANTLTISDKIAFKDEKAKFDVRIFTKVLRYVALNKVRNSVDSICTKMFQVIIEFESELKTSNVDSKYLFDAFLTRLWKVSRGISL